MRGFVNIYSPKAKNDIRLILSRFLEHGQAERYTDNILTVLDELIKNGIKGNYKYLLVIEKIGRFLLNNPSPHNPGLNEILRSPKLYQEFVDSHINFADFDPLVRKVLNQEAKTIQIKTRLQKEQRQVNAEEKLQLGQFSDLMRLRKKSKIYGIYLQVNMHFDRRLLIIEVINSAPILKKDLDILLEKRRTFGEYASRGEEQLFFIENMDSNAVGAGLGYGTIDSSLLDMGLKPEEALTIITANNTTILITLELAKIGRGRPTEFVSA